MNFMKKNWGNLLIILAIGLLFIPPVKNWVQSQLLMKPALHKLDEELTFGAADWDMDLKGINTPNAHLRDFKGKVLFLNFWATWCGPCKVEWPSIEALYLQKKSNVSFVLIAMQDEEPKVRAFLAKNKWTTPVYIATSPISDQLMPQSYPTTLIISKSGKILKKETSSSNWNSPSVHQFLNQISGY